MSEFLRLIVPDVHGHHQDDAAVAALEKDLRVLKPKEVVVLGDLLDCGGLFNTHLRNYAAELDESYEDDIDAGNALLDMLQEHCDGQIHYLEGNHEQHVERWAARQFNNRKDADALLERYSPQGRLRLRDRGIKYYRRDTFYQGLSLQGTIQLGKCAFVHGICCNKYATDTHLQRFGCSVVHGHTHRAQVFNARTVMHANMIAACPGTLAKLQPLYMHTNPTNHTHGYAVQFVNSKTGTFLHIQVPIYAGQSMLLAAAGAMTRKK